MDIQLPLSNTGNFLQIRRNIVPGIKEQQEMSTLFRDVMKGLHFYAHESFLTRLFNTEYILTIRNKSGTLLGFGNAEVRYINKKKVIHILSIYVSPLYKSKNLMAVSWKEFLKQMIVKNYFCLFNPLYVTASAVNPVPMLALSRTVPVWPDFLFGKNAPEEIREIAEETAKKYPVAGDKLFQVGITRDFAGIRSEEEAKSSDPEFDNMFYQYADPENMKLILFVARIRVRDIIRIIRPYKKKNWRK